MSRVRVQKFSQRVPQQEIFSTRTRDSHIHSFSKKENPREKILEDFLFCHRFRTWR